MVDTRPIPPFLYESQKEFYSLRREFALMVKFPFDPDQEEVYIGTLTDEGATAALAKMTTEFEAYKKKTSKSGTKKLKGKVTTTTVTKTAAGTTKRFPRTQAMKVLQQMHLPTKQRTKPRCTNVRRTTNPWTKPQIPRIPLRAAAPTTTTTTHGTESAQKTSNPCVDAPPYQYERKSIQEVVQDGPAREVLRRKGERQDL